MSLACSDSKIKCLISTCLKCTLWSKNKDMSSLCLLTDILTWKYFTLYFIILFLITYFYIICNGIFLLQFPPLSFILVLIACLFCSVSNWELHTLQIPKELKKRYMLSLHFHSSHKCRSRKIWMISLLFLLLFAILKGNRKLAFLPVNQQQL